MYKGISEPCQLHSEQLFIFTLTAANTDFSGKIIEKKRYTSIKCSKYKVFLHRETFYFVSAVYIRWAFADTRLFLCKSTGYFLHGYGFRADKSAYVPAS